MNSISRLLKIVLCCIVLHSVAACSTTSMVKTAVDVGITAAQERAMGHALDDKTLYMELKTNYLAQDEGLFMNVHVKVIEARVHLTGSVKTPYDRIEAVRMAWQPLGVREVINEIQVTDRADWKHFTQDQWIRGQLHSKLFLAADVSSINYSSDVVDGVVYLMGIAKSQSELEHVAYIASTIYGVKKVVSHVRLKHSPSRDLSVDPEALYSKSDDE